MDLNSVIGSRIKEVRENRSMTQNEMGRLLGHTDVYISQIETGKRRIGLDLLQKIAQVLDVSPLIFFKDVWQGEEAVDQISTLIRRVDVLRQMLDDLTHAVHDLAQQRRAAAEPDSTTAAIMTASQSLDAPLRQLLLEIAHAIKANPTALTRSNAMDAADGNEALGVDHSDSSTRVRAPRRHHDFLPTSHGLLSPAPTPPP